MAKHLQEVLEKRLHWFLGKVMILVGSGHRASLVPWPTKREGTIFSHIGVNITRNMSVFFTSTILVPLGVIRVWSWRICNLSVWIGPVSQRTILTNAMHLYESHGMIGQSWSMFTASGLTKWRRPRTKRPVGSKPKNVYFPFVKSKYRCISL